MSFEGRGMDDDAFGPKGGFSALKTFDAFPKTKASYTQRSAGGGYMTVLLVLLSALLTVSEFRHWWSGTETQKFSVEKGVAHTMQINLDAVVAMRCDDLNVNVQDASGDRILAGETLNRHPTVWRIWADPKRMQKQQVNRDKELRQGQLEEDRHVDHVMGEVRHGGKKFPKTPKTPRNWHEDACRIFGSLEVNRVQGDFHITARGHGYADNHDHLKHEAFNFTHMISELSFGPLYPSILNPLDNTAASTEDNLARYQYYMSVVPTVFTRSSKPKLPPVLSDPKAQQALRAFYRGNTIITNQYAVTSHSKVVGEDGMRSGSGIPGIFFKFDIEPILLTVSQTSGSLLALLMHMINVLSGVLVGGAWLYKLWGWADENFLARGRRRGGSSNGYYEKGMIHGGHND